MTLGLIACGFWLCWVYGWCLLLVGYCGLVRFASLVLFLVLFSLGSVIAVRVCLEFVDNSVIVALLVIRCCFAVAFKLAWVWVFVGFAVVLGC